MNHPQFTPTPIARRHFLRDCGVGLGKIAFASLLSDAFSQRSRANENENALAPRAPHFPAKAKRVIHLFMAGAPSHLDLFDPKPKLTEMTGQDLPESVRKGQRITGMTSGQKNLFCVGN